VVPSLFPLPSFKASQHASDHPPVYHSEIGAWGYIQATEELRLQIQEANIEFDDIVVTIGAFFAQNQAL